jgi:hypothetical protein
MKFVILALLSLLATTHCFASESHAYPQFYESLRRLNPLTRLDQICDYEAMLRIDRDPNPFRPDRAKAEVVSTSQRASDSITTDGGAFRSDGRWYVLSYTCKTSADQMTVTSFTYRIGKRIPESEWAKYGLWR